MILNQAIDKYLAERDGGIKRWIRDISFHDSKTHEALLDAAFEGSFVRNIKIVLLPERDFPNYRGEGHN